MDIQRIRDDEKIRMNVPIHLVGEDVAPGVKLGGGSAYRLITEVEVSCFPKDLPEYFEVDISHLELDEMLYLSDIKPPEGVELIELAHGEEHDHAIVSIHVSKAAPVEEETTEEEEAAAAGEAAAPDEGKEKSDED